MTSGQTVEWDYMYEPYEYTQELEPTYEFDYYDIEVTSAPRIIRRVSAIFVSDLFSVFNTRIVSFRKNGSAERVLAGGKPASKPSSGKRYVLLFLAAAAAVLCKFFGFVCTAPSL